MFFQANKTIHLQRPLLKSDYNLGERLLVAPALATAKVFISIRSSEKFQDILTRRDWRQEIRPAPVSKLYIMITQGLILVQLPSCVRPAAGLHQVKHLKMAGKEYF
jgi:hypothetical protein